MKKIIALVASFILAICLAVVGFSAPAQAVTCTDYQTQWYTQQTSYYDAPGVPTKIGVALRYRKCSDNTYKALAIGGYYNLGQSSVDCADNFGSDFNGVYFDFSNRADDIIGGVDPTERKIACWPSGRPGPSWWDISANTTKVAGGNVYYAFHARMAIDRSGAVDPDFYQFGWPTPTV